MASNNVEYVTLLPQRRRAEIAAWLVGAKEVAVADGADLVRIARSMDRLAAIVDPELAGDSELLVAATAARSWSVRLDCAPTASGLAALWKWTSGPIHHVTFRDFDPPEGVTRVDRPASDPPMFSELLQRLTPQLRSLPAVVAVQLVRLIAGSTQVASPHSFAVVCGVHRRRLERWLARAGLAGPWMMVAGCRLVHSFPDIVDARQSFSRVARTHGFGSLQALQRQALVVTGSPLRALRNGTSSSAFIESIARHLTSVHTLV